MRDVRGPGQGRNTSNARELATLARDFGLHDAWILKKGGTFVPTWKRGTSETRLDRFYVSEGLIPVVADVAVGSFPPELGRISDHYPVILSMALPDRRLEGKRFWKFDLAVLADDEAKDILRAGINRTLTNARNPSLEWDALKSQWQHWAKESGRNAKMRLARDLNETLRRIRIVNAGAPLTPTTREYLELLRARYDRLFLKTTQKANLYAQDTIFRDAPELTRFLRSRRSPDGPSMLQVLHRAVFSFFWDGSTERLQRDALRLPRCLGGYGLPCIGTMAQLLALRTVLGILDDVGAPARPLAMFFLGPLRRTLVPRALGNLYPSAVIIPAYYRALVALSRELTALDPDLNPREVPPARLCEQLVSARTTLNSPPPTFPWLELTSGRLPKEAADLQWQRAWRILPTLDRLQRWGIVQYARCPNCGSTETAAHAVSTCVVARTFWLLVHRSMPSLRVANYYTRDRCPRGALGRLAIAAGEYVLWRNRCRACVRRRRLWLQWPLLAQFRRTILSFLEAQLSIHGEVEFLRHWSCPFLSVVNGKVRLSVVFPDQEVL
ncbi:hypothetical protein HPB52_022680 [Rhipicephalus sanguineus]|uniref:Reverse transcriptase zinc-binding domain-containing protein n=1 Tax=Rhipicephalus sanguineus TaxID=34632 RepID=A0A9D4Q0J9_RHISA|nr:hypothetical protein HPB52_022680 [Rhipicephalus sanguineus]